VEFAPSQTLMKYGVKAPISILVHARGHIHDQI
jgi:hypothetical protein